MTLAVNQNLHASDIKTIAPLKAGIVFALKGFGADELVIKIEPESPNAYKMAGKVVKLFDPSAKAFVLAHMEVEELKNYCNTCIEYEDFFGGIEGTYGSLYSRASANSSKDILVALGQGKTAVKMQKLNVNTLESALNERYEKQNKQPLRDLCKILRTNEGLVKLGNMMAADAFIGNSDRFSYQWGVARNPKFGGMTIKLQVLNNIGNLMWVMDGGQGSLSMLDYIDSGSSFRNWAPLNEGSEKWPIRFMADKGGRIKCAEQVVSDLEAILSPKRSTFSKSKLGKGAVDIVANAMAQALSTIVIEFKGKAMSTTCQKGLQERYVLLKTLFK